LKVANAAVGAGILAIPYAFRQSGFILGVFIVLSVGVFTAFSLNLVGRLIVRSQKFTYETLTIFVFGRWAGYVIKFITIVLPCGSMIAYVIVIGDTIPDVLKYFLEGKVHCAFYNRTSRLKTKKSYFNNNFSHIHITIEFFT
jgi:solute carrier family 38 (sodium-coupled neutral amino acid transporter), member 11